MDVGEKLFRGIYIAVKYLTGLTLKYAGVPMSGLPGLALGFHSPHALALFRAIRAEAKYSDKREHMQAIEKSMHEFMKVIGEAIQASSPVPESPPVGTITDLASRDYRKRVDEFVAHARFFVEALDFVLDDISRCIKEWNEFLREVAKFLRADKPRNVFELLEQKSLHNARDWAWYTDETGFMYSVNRLCNHRDAYAKLIGLAPHGSLPRLDFASK